MDGKRPSVSSLRGIVAAAHPQAAQAGAAILRAGGNAFDAAAATAAALNVVEPYMSGLAGMGMATCYIAAEQRVRTLDFITRVPSEFPAGRFTDREQLSRGPIATGTPGNLAGWCELVSRYGRKQLADVFAPAIDLARNGFPLTEYNVSAISDTAEEFTLPLPLREGERGRGPDEPFQADWARTYNTGGTILRQPDLARTYEAIVAEGPRHLHGGALGNAIVEHVRALGRLPYAGRSGICRAGLARSVGGDLPRHPRAHAAAALRGLSGTCWPSASSMAVTLPAWNVTASSTLMRCTARSASPRAFASPTTTHHPIA